MDRFVEGAVKMYALDFGLWRAAGGFRLETIQGSVYHGTRRLLD